MNQSKVLIVEDDKWLAQQQSLMLSRAGYLVTHVVGADEAIAAIDDLVPDVIVLDVLLPGTTAFSLMHELQSYGDTGAIPIILSTNLAADLSLDDLAPYGVRRLLDKTTMLPDDLLAAVRGVLL